MPEGNRDQLTTGCQANQPPASLGRRGVPFIDGFASIDVNKRSRCVAERGAPSDRIVVSRLRWVPLKTGGSVFICHIGRDHLDLRSPEAYSKRDLD